MSNENKKLISKILDISFYTITVLIFIMIVSLIITYIISYNKSVLG